MSGASAHLIASPWTSANTFRRSLALNLTRLPAGGAIWQAVWAKALIAARAVRNLSALLALKRDPAAKEIARVGVF